uniref:Uncharacterized protein n=1 Tax=viral metagenome TaxID=1070528 RepID=A0A6H1ZZK5_9ZZZZ
MRDYEEYYRTQMEDGALFQDFVVDVAWQAGLVIAQYASKTYQFSVGESRSGVEIKHDKQRKSTGNLYVEYAEKRRPRPGPYAPAGIMRNDHWLFAVGDYDVVYFFANNLLRGLFAASKADGSPKYRRVQSRTSQGFLLPEDDGAKYAALVLRPDAAGKVEQRITDLEGLARSLHVVMLENPKQLTLF